MKTKKWKSGKRSETKLGKCRTKYGELWKSKKITEQIISKTTQIERKSKKSIIGFWDGSSPWNEAIEHRKLPTDPMGKSSEILVHCLPVTNIPYWFLLWSSALLLLYADRTLPNSPRSHHKASSVSNMPHTSSRARAHTHTCDKCKCVN